MYPILLTVHGALRWLILAAALWAVVLAFTGWLAAKPWTKRARIAGVVYVGLFDLQLLLGLALYFLSPVVKAALGNMGVAMKEHELRFFAVEHIFEMVLALAVAHAGSVLVKKIADDAGKYRAAALCYGTSLVLVLAAIPWWRPLLRF